MHNSGQDIRWLFFLLKTGLTGCCRPAGSRTGKKPSPFSYQLMNS
uniref:Uncharacterized protein n=1 Tax=uncultured Desulfobacterium sp. TaxID=201089 RepID=E1YHB4_9BACT|nr:unknown protein [uncultured Desulfobacterium sp.]